MCCRCLCCRRHILAVRKLYLLLFCYNVLKGSTLLPDSDAMEVPFVSSGALSRAHYTLVRKIESATSIQSANQFLIPEIKFRREHLGRPGLSLVRRLPTVVVVRTLIYEQEQCKESLIILLYCHMTVAHDFLPTDAFDFAIPHAIGLAEASQRLEQKRIGICIPFSPLDHRLYSIKAICFALKSCLRPTTCS
jgi:hypothetical protein